MSSSHTLSWKLSDQDLTALLQQSEASAPYRAACSLPLETWIHLRYCSTYPVHGWVHFAFARALLYSLFSSTRQFPIEAEISAAVHVATRLLRRLPSDVLELVGAFTIELAAPDWIPDTQHLSRSERALTAVLADAWFMRLREPMRYFDLHVPPQVSIFLTDPLRYYPEAEDILALPLIRRQSEAASSGKAAFTVSVKCECGRCPRIQRQLEQTLREFRTQYFRLVADATERGCGALEEAWEPVLQNAEEWLDALMERIESPSSPFSWMERNRPGPAVCEVAQRLELEVGAELTRAQLLAFTFTLAHVYDVLQSVPLSLPPDYLGYHDFHMHAPGNRLYARTGWLYDLASPASSDAEGDIALLCEQDGLSIDVRGEPIESVAFALRARKADVPGRLPSYHAKHTTVPFVHPEPTLGPDLTSHTSLILSASPADGYVLANDPGRKDAYATLLRSFCAGRIIETPYRPSVEPGTSCDHTAWHGIMTYCAPSSLDLLSLVQPADTDLLSTPRFPDPDAKRLEEYRALLAPLLDGLDAPFARSRVCIVRCGEGEGSPEPVVAIAAAAGKKVYVVHRRECWNCALARMRVRGCTVAIVNDTRVRTACARCQPSI